MKGKRVCRTIVLLLRETVTMHTSDSIIVIVFVIHTYYIYFNTMSKRLLVKLNQVFGLCVVLTSIKLHICTFWKNNDWCLFACEKVAVMKTVVRSLRCGW